MTLKPVVFMGSTKNVIRRFPYDAKKEAGLQLQRVQAGSEPADWKPMAAVGPGAKEIRIHHPHEHRVIYVAQFPEAVYVLHAFGKKTQQTPDRHIERARAAYAEVKSRRQQKS